MDGIDGWMDREKRSEEKRMGRMKIYNERVSIKRQVALQGSGYVGMTDWRIDGLIISNV